VTKKGVVVEGIVNEESARNMIANTMSDGGAEVEDTEDMDGGEEEDTCVDRLLVRPRANRDAVATTLMG